MAAILAAILVYMTKREFNKSNPYMKFGIINDLVRVTTDRQMDRQMDGQAENNRAPPTFVGVALIKSTYIQISQIF